MTPRLLLLLLLAIATLQAADDPTLAALRAADDERVSATLAGDRVRLLEIFADDLRYAHSSGAVDTKATLINTLASGRLKYESIRYEERSFEVLTPEIALMTGRAHVQVVTADGPLDTVLSFLAVWREEKGKWRFRAWQSCKIPAQTSAAAGPKESR